MMKISDGLEDGPKKPVLSLLEEFWKWEDFSLDIDEIIDLNELKYFPNPTSGILNISYSGNLIISVFDINGRKLLLTENKTIDFTEFNDGIYIVKVKELNSNFVKHFKIIKK